MSRKQYPWLVSPLIHQFYWQRVNVGRYVAPDLLHPEQEGDFEAHAFNNYAEMAQRAHLRPGDRAVMRGTLRQQTIELESGATTSISHLYVTSLEVLSRSKRTSITAYEQGRTK